MKDKNKYLPFLLPFRCIIFLLTFATLAFVTDKKVNEISNYWSVTASLVNLVTILILVVIAKKQGSNYWKLINYQKGKTTVKQILAMSGIILLLGIIGMYFAGYVCYGVIAYVPSMMIAPIPLWIAIINCVLLPISTAFAEDGLYLGCGVNQIKNKYQAIIIPAFFFALQHCFIPTLFDTKYMIYRFLSFLPLTLILCRIYYKRRNPLPIIIGHTIIDLATAMQILSTSLFPDLYETMCGK